MTRNHSKKRPPATDDEVLASKRTPVSVQPLVVEGNDNKDLETQSLTVADGSTADDGTLRLANDNEDINPNICCMCFVTYEDVLARDGAVWIPFPCGR